MIEALNMPATFVAIQVFLFLCASRQRTGVVWDSGENVSHTVRVLCRSRLALHPSSSVLYSDQVSGEDPYSGEGTTASERGGSRTSCASFALNHDADTMYRAEKIES